MEHRTTPWRWKTGRSLPRGWRRCRKERERVWLGKRQKYRPLDWRRRRSKQSDSSTRKQLRFVAALLEERRHSVDVDHEKVGAEFAERCKRDATREIFRELLCLRRQFAHPDLVRTACFDLLQLGTRTRQLSRQQLDDKFWTEKVDKNGQPLPAFVARLMKASPGSVRAEVESALREAQKNGNFEWVVELLKPEAGDQPTKAALRAGEDGRGKAVLYSVIATPSEKRPCVSKVFYGIDRKMVYYWRRHSDYDQAVISLGCLAGIAPA
jgi:hypothetical protein